MKKVFIILLVLLFIPLVALSDALYYAEDDILMAEAVAKEWGLTLNRRDTRIDALDALAADDSGLAILTEQQFIEALQGYSQTERDMVENGFEIVTLLGQSDLYLVCSQATAQNSGISGLASLMEYLARNEYSLMLMRSLSASRSDYVSGELLNALCFDTEMFLDESDKYEHINDEDNYFLVCGTEQALRFSKEGAVILGALTEERTDEFPELQCAGEVGLPAFSGSWYALCSRKGSLHSGLPLELSSDLLSSYYLHRPTESISLDKEIRNLIHYMTEEGLFFY